MALAIVLEVEPIAGGKVGTSAEPSWVVLLTLSEVDEEPAAVASGAESGLKLLGAT